MLTSSARFETPNGSRYLQQLCKHFAHKTRVEFTPQQGRAHLSPGPAEMFADESGLDLRVTANNEDGLARAQDIVERHLARFAFREEMPPLDWRA